MSGFLVLDAAFAFLYALFSPVWLVVEVYVALFGPLFTAGVG